MGKAIRRVSSTNHYRSLRIDALYREPHPQPRTYLLCLLRPLGARGAAAASFPSWRLRQRIGAERRLEWAGSGSESRRCPFLAGEPWQAPGLL